MNDVRVICLNMNTVLIEDIAVDCPHGVTVSIPAAKASKSKDLWRLLSQKQLFRLNPGPFADYPTPAPPPSSAEADRLREENRLLAEQNQLLRTALDNQGGKLDTILTLLENPRLAAVFPTANGSAPLPATKATEVVDAGVPTYIPSEIKPKNVESHVEVKSETSEGTAITGAGEALRKLRKGVR
jgi:hypothetical protein